MNSKSLKMGGLVLGASMVLAVGVSYLTTTSQEIPMWRKVGQVIQAATGDLALKYGSNDTATTTKAQIVEVWERDDMIKTLTAPVCSIKTPNATSSVTDLGIFVGKPATTTGVIGAYVSATATATTTKLASFGVTADVPYSGFASTTQNAWNDIAPNQFVNFSYEANSTFLGHGECAVKFRTFASSTPL